MLFFFLFNAFCSVIPSLRATRNRATCNNYGYMHFIDAKAGISIYSYFYLKKSSSLLHWSQNMYGVSDNNQIATTANRLTCTQGPYTLPW
jgi:hypothetical protein